MAIKVGVIDGDNPDPDLLKRAARLIVKGEVLVCPTDTGYAFAANALDTKAVTKVFNLKGRDFSKPIHITVSSMEEARKYAHVNKAAEHLAGKFLPGALTLVLRKKEIIPSLLVAGLDTVGIRIPDNKVILGLANLSGVPITSTSANISGTPTPYTAREVVEQMGENTDIALVLDQGELPSHGLSTIIDLTVSPPRLLRQGLISWENILAVLKSARESE